VSQVLQSSRVPPCRFSAIATDTRALEPGALFVALVGERFDGHDFLSEALARGARGAVVREGVNVPEGMVAFHVPDTLVALGNLGRESRRAITGPVLAVTGTNGKTATRQMLAAVLGVRYRVHATEANYNNRIGVPLTLLRAPPGTQALVVEAGASIPGEIAALRSVIEPSLAVITNVAAGHLEGFGSEEDVLREKLAILTGASCAIVGAHPPALATRARTVVPRVVVAGTDEDADMRPQSWKLDDGGRPLLSVDGVELSLPVVGRHQVDNAMLACAAAQELGIPTAAAARALSTVRLPPGRCEVLHHDDLVVLHDAYNANPLSVAMSLETAQAMRGGRPLVVVLGTMLELGPRSAELHASVAAQVMASQPALVAVVGDFVPAFEPFAAALEDRLLTADDVPTLGERLARRLTGHEFVLLKASRGVRLERVISYLLPGGAA
jgi:UDP-N-acetylmuramoyl-tripeptide--D-alanyl-D-alanine ligase